MDQVRTAMQRRTETWAYSVLIPGLAAVILSGCGGSDLSGYRPLEKTSSHPARAVSENDAASQDSASDSPIIPDVADAKADLADEVPVSALGPVNVIDGTSVSNLLKTVPAEATDPAVQPASAVAAKPRTVELLIPEKTFQRDTASKALRVSYDDLDLLKVLNLEPVTDNAVELMPAWLKELDGKRIRIRGFMYPTFEAEGIETFALARDNQICCFGRDPKVYDLVQVDMRSGKTTVYIPPTRSFDVVGKFKIEMISEGGKPYGLYHIEEAEIIDR
jgi:hypothetical protein